MLAFTRRLLADYGHAGDLNYAPFVTAFTHPTGSRRTSGERHEARDDSYQRLEFLGDAVIGLAAASYLYDRYPTCNEGFLTNMRSMLVSGATLASLGKKLGMHEHVVLTERAEAHGMRESAKVHEDVFEAFVGALYLASDASKPAGAPVGGRGFEVAYAFLVRVFEAHVDFAELVCRQDPVQRLAEWIRTTSTLARDPVFHTVQTGSAPDGRPLFTSRVTVGGRVLGAGSGPSRRLAEHDAAIQALSQPSEDPSSSELSSSSVWSRCSNR